LTRAQANSATRLVHEAMLSVSPRPSSTMMPSQQISLGPPSSS
jgi:hypothetical protein